MRYLPFVQQPYCCVPASIQMILHRRGLKVLAQEEIGYHLGLTVPLSDHFAVPGARVNEHAPSEAGFGTQVQTENYSLNKFFNRYGYDLQFELFTPEAVGNHHDWLRRQIDAGNDVICCFDYPSLYSDHGGKGHVSVVDDVETTATVLIDPGYSVPKRRRVESSRLINSMTLHGPKNSGGYWLISGR
jgi:hypothetical protein